MKKIMSKHWSILTAVIISSGFLCTGCSQIDKVSFWKNKNRKSERINILEEKVELLSHSMGSLTNENYELKKNLSELETVRNQLDKEYTQIKSMQASIESSQNTASTRLEEELSETNNMLEEIKQKLALVEQDKNNIKAKLEKLEGARKQTAEPVAVKGADLEEEKHYTDRSSESLIKETQKKRKSTLVEDLLDKAIQLYRQEKYEEAIAKWEEVLALDPGKLEAKFNIEIANDRIKERQIQEDLKASRTQRK